MPGLRSPTSGNTPKQLGSGCLSLFGLPFLAAGIFITYLYFSTVIQWWSGRNWVEVPCQIESVDIKAGDDSSRTVATFIYRYEGRDYIGDRVSFWGDADNIGSFQQDAFRELSECHRRKGRKFRCFVDPARPSNAVIDRKLRWEIQAFMSVFALTFPAVGAGLVVGGLLGIGVMNREARLREESVMEPWKWRTAWTESTIPEDASIWKSGLYVYTIWSGLIIFPLFAAMLVDDAFGRGKSWLVLILPALWCLPAWFSLQRLRHRLAVGATRLDLATRPVSPGGPLQAQWLLVRPLPARAAVECTLCCEKSVTTKDSDSDSTVVEKVWSHRESVPADRLLRDLSGFRLPVSFAFPADAPESTHDLSVGPKFAWKLEFAVPNTAIRAKFLIPVFRPGTPPTARLVEPAPRMMDVVRGDLPELLEASRIQAIFSPAGLPQLIVCPPSRYLATILIMIVFNTIWTTLCVLIISKHAPLWFALVFYGSAAAMWVGVFWMALHKRTVNFSGSGLEIQHRFGPLTWGCVVPKSQILSFSHNTNMSSGNRTYYRIRLERATGKKATLVDAILGETTAIAMQERLEEWKKSLG
jgi:hypothetical protein